MTKPNLESDTKPEPTFCQLEISELRQGALTGMRKGAATGSRLYARACNMMIACKQAKTLGELQNARKYYALAEIAYLRSLEDEVGQVRHIREAQGAIKELGKEVSLRRAG